MIDLVFYGGTKRSKREQAVLGAWKEYLDLLSEDFARMTEVQQQAHWSKADDLFVNLLDKMASDLGLAFDRVQLKKGAYSPLAHGRSEQTQRQLMEALVKSFSGQQPLKMELAGVPDREAMQLSQQVLERIAEALERGVQVK